MKEAGSKKARGGGTAAAGSALALFSKLGWVLETEVLGGWGVKSKEEKSLPCNSTKKPCLAGEDPEPQTAAGTGMLEAETHCSAVTSSSRHC